MTARVLVDTSVLLAVCDLGRPEIGRLCTEYIESRYDLCVSEQVLREFAVVATRPVEMNGLGLSMDHALENIRRFCEFAPLLPGRQPSEHRVLVDLLRAHPVTGKRIHDANLVATALAHGLARIVTLNVSDFEGFDDTVTIVDPTRQ